MKALLETLLRDFRYGLRSLRKSPAFTLVAVLTLSLGIGANTAIFSVVNGVLLEPLPYPHPEELVDMELSPLAIDPSIRGMADAIYFIFREQNRSFQDIGIYLATDSDRDVNVTGFARPERVHALHVTDGVLSALGIEPIVGRIFSRSDDSAQAVPTAILTYGYWLRKFSGSPLVIGKTIAVDGTAREIIGVLPRSFRFLDEQDLAILLPLQLDRNKAKLGGFPYYGIGRLKPGVTLEQAAADSARLVPISLTAFALAPGFSFELFEKARLAPNLQPLKQEIVGDISTLLWVLMGGIAMVLLIACANVANLLLVRSEGRQQELAVRAALGASRRRIAVLLLSESASIGLLATVLGLGMAWAALRLLITFAPAGLPRISDIRLDLPVLLFTLATALLTSLLVGLIPVFRHAGTRPAVETTRSLSLSRERHRARNLLVTVQVALALVLLVCSGLMIRTFRALTDVNPGFAEPAQLQTFRISIPAIDQPDDPSVTRMEQQMQDELADIPGVSSAAFSSSAPMDGDGHLDNIYVADHNYAQVSPPLRHYVYVSPGYFQTLGIPLVAGRDLNWAETNNKVPVALVSEGFARENWGSATAALGKRVRGSGGGDWRQIIGVVGDVHDEGVDHPPRNTVYYPTIMANYQSQPLRVSRHVTFSVRSSQAGAMSLMQQIRRVIWSVDANLPLARVYTLNYYYIRSLARTSFTLVMLGIAGSMALLLGAVGLYGVLGYSVSQRRREIGIRMALGSQRAHILKLILSEGMLVTLAGLAVGLAGSLVSTRFLSSLLYGVTATDPLTFALVVTLLGLVAFVACYVPARRASHVDPMVTLRCE